MVEFIVTIVSMAVAFLVGFVINKGEPKVEKVSGKMQPGSKKIVDAVTKLLKKLGGKK